MLEDKVLQELNCSLAEAKFEVSLKLSQCIDCEQELYDLYDNLSKKPKRWTRIIAAIRLEINSKMVELEQCRQEHKEALDRLSNTQTALDEYQQNIDEASS